MRTFFEKEEGSSLVPYALVAGLIALVTILAVNTTGTKVSDIFSNAAMLVDGEDVNPPENAVPVILTSGLPQATIGEAYTASLEAVDDDGDTLSWNVSGLPSGLSVSTGGILSGTPSIEGSFDVLASVSDGRGGEGSVELAMTVSAPCIASSETIAPTYAGPWDVSVTDKTVRTTRTAPPGCTTLVIELSGGIGIGFETTANDGSRDGGSGGFGIVRYENVAPGQQFYIQAGMAGRLQDGNFRPGDWSGVFLGTSADRSQALVVVGGGGNTAGSVSARGGDGGGPNQPGEDGRKAAGTFEPSIPPTGGTLVAGGNGGTNSTGTGANGTAFDGTIGVTTFAGGGGGGWYSGGAGALYQSGAGGSGYANTELVSVESAQVGGGAAVIGVQYYNRGSDGHGWVTLNWE